MWADHKRIKVDIYVNFGCHLVIVYVHNTNVDRLTEILTIFDIQNTMTYLIRLSRILSIPINIDFLNINLSPI